MQLGPVAQGRSSAENLAAVYHRISTSRQGDGCSLEYRSKNTLALAESLGLAVAPERILDEVGSGADPFRPSFAHLWKLVEGREVACVLAYWTDRLPGDELQVASSVRPSLLGSRGRHSLCGR